MWDEQRLDQKNAARGMIKSLMGSKPIRYPVVNQYRYGTSPSLIGKPTVNSQCSIALLVYQRVPIYYLLLYYHLLFPSAHDHG